MQDIIFVSAIPSWKIIMVYYSLLSKLYCANIYMNFFSTKIESIQIPFSIR